MFLHHRNSPTAHPSIKYQVVINCSWGERSISRVQQAGSERQKLQLSHFGWLLNPVFRFSQNFYSCSWNMFTKSLMDFTSVCLTMSLCQTPVCSGTKPNSSVCLCFYCFIFTNPSLVKMKLCKQMVTTEEQIDLSTKPAKNSSLSSDNHTVGQEN